MLGKMGSDRSRIDDISALRMWPLISICPLMGCLQRALAALCPCQPADTKCFRYSWREFGFWSSICTI